MHCWSETLDPGKCSSGLEGFYHWKEPFRWKRQTWETAFNQFGIWNMGEVLEVLWFAFQHG